MSRHFYAYLGIGLAEAFLVSFMGLLTAGKVPIPAQWAWIVPALAAALLFLTTQLPKLQAGELAATTTTTTVTSVPVTPAAEPAAPVVAAPPAVVPAPQPVPPVIAPEPAPVVKKA